MNKTMLLLLYALAALCMPGVLVAKEESIPSYERTLSLSGADWRICSDPDGNGKDRRVFEADASASDWTSASVPGNIQGDLEAAHLLKPLWYGNGDPRLQDVARTDWWYRKDFPTAGRHTLQIAVLGQQGPRARDSQIAIDGFRIEP